MHSVFIRKLVCMKEYKKPILVEEIVTIEDIIAVSTAGEYDDDIEWGGTIIH